MRYLALVSVLLWSLEAHADAKLMESHDAVILEFMIGSIGALSGGLIGAFAASYPALPEVEACRRSCRGYLCLCGLTVIPYMMWGYAIGVPLGATIGVSLVGYFNGVSGNIMFAITGAVVGEVVGIAISYLALYASSLLQGTADSGTLMGASVFLVIPASSSLGATIGFNIGARQHTPSPSSWSLPIIVWRF